MDIPLEEVSVSVTGYSDAKGFFDLDDNARAGFSHIRGQINIKSSASDDDLNRLKLAVNRHCPVLDDLKSPVDVELDLVRQ
jgi:putative redox protein